MRSRLLLFIPACCALFPFGLVTAEETATTAMFPQDRNVYFYLGDVDAEINRNELESPGSEFALGLGVLFAQTSWFDWGPDVIVIYRQYDTPTTVSGGAFTVVSDDMSLSTIGLSLNGRFSYVAEPVRLYAGAGAGLYFSKLTLSASTFGFPGTYEEQSNDPGLSYFFGLMVRISTADYLGLEYRYLELDANLVPVTSGTVEIGGELVVLTYTYKF